MIEGMKVGRNYGRREGRWKGMKGKQGGAASLRGLGSDKKTQQRRMKGIKEHITP